MLTSTTQLMHIELPRQYEESLNRIITLLGIEANITDSFNASGETIIIAADKTDLEKILELDESELTQTVNFSEAPPSVPDVAAIKGILNEQLHEDISSD